MTATLSQRLHWPNRSRFRQQPLHADCDLLNSQFRDHHKLQH